MGTAFSGSIRTSRAFSGEIGTPAAFSGDNRTPRAFSGDNHPASTHCPATPSAPEQSYLKRRRSTNVHASFGSFFFAHRQTPRHQRSKTPGLHEGIMRLPAPDQIDIPITGTNASQALGALEDCPPPRSTYWNLFVENENVIAKPSPSTESAKIPTPILSHNRFTR